MRARGLVHVSMKLTLIDNSFMVDDELGNRDLLIRSVCFSPDGKYLATGAEDMKIRASLFCRCLFNRF